MNRKLFFTTSAFIALISISASAQWQVVQTQVTARLWDVCVVNSSLVWACGDSGKVLKSSNGGQTWQAVSSGLPVLTFSKLSALDVNTAWIASQSINRGIFRTTNGGQNWSEYDYSPKSYINKVHFFNSNTGYFIADPVNDTLGFFITRNGGVNWNRSSASPTGNIVVIENGVSQSDTGFIWFGSGIGSNSSFYKLAGGLNNTWQSYPYGYSGVYRFVIFKDSQTGLATNGSRVLKTTNGGINWSLLNDSAISDVATDFILVPGTDWVILNGPRRIRVSYDLCNTWQPLVDYYSNSAFLLAYSDAKDTSSIWIAADNGRLLKYNRNFIGIKQISSGVPGNYRLHQNFPNPFNPVTKIRFELPLSASISFKVYDVSGRILSGFEGFKAAGIYEIEFNGTNLSSGVYFYGLSAGTYRIFRKMVITR